MAFYSNKVVSSEFVGPMTGTASFAVSASTAFSSSTSVMATNANNFRVSGSLIVTGSSTFVGTASFTNLGPLNQNLTVTGSLLAHGINAAQQSVNTGSAYASIVGGLSNTIRSSFSTGRDFNTILNGSNNIISQSVGSLVAGNSAIIESSSVYAFAFGNNVRITNKSHSFVFGNDITASFSNTVHVNNLWVSGSIIGGNIAAGGATVTISGSAPSGSRASGSLWWNDDNGNLYIQTAAPTGSVYVPAVANVITAVSTSFASTASFVATASNALLAVSASALSGSTPTYLMAQNGTMQPISSSVITTITGWSTYAASNAGEWNASSGTFTATKRGWYSLSAFLTYGSTQDNTGAEYGVAIDVNGSIIANARFFTPSNQTQATFKQSTTATSIVSLNIGDTVKVQAYHNAGGMRTLHSNGCIFTMQELPGKIQR